MAVVIGVVAFGEKLDALQAVAAVLATVAVVLLTYGLGVPPWIALTLALTFGVYGLVKKRLSVDPTVSVTAEVLLLAPLALIWLAGLEAGVWSEAAVPAGISWATIPATGGRPRCC